MCGILGIVGDVDRIGDAVFAGALDTIAHRGPDDSGIHRSPGALLGHRRLSIIDLSPAGHQPMIDAATGAQITYNGEIYNYLELRRDLEREGVTFVSRSDTEVLLKGWQQWGPAVLERANGMWAFALWLPKERRLVLARDRFGVKPLVYAQSGATLAFASEPKAILALGLVPATPDRAAVARFIAQSRLHGEGATFYAGIRSLPPAHWASFSADGRLSLQRYWSYPDGATDVAPSARDADAEFAHLFDDAVKLRLRSDVPVGLTLSGGLDSSAVLAAMAKSGTGEHLCFTAVFPGYEMDETSWATRAAQPFGIEPIRVSATGDDWLATLERIVWHMDSPGFSPAVYPLWAIMREARTRDVRVLLEGQGADELLAGYPQYAAVAALALMSPGGVASGRLGAHLAAMGRTFTWPWALRWLLREAFPSAARAFQSRRGGLSLLRADLRGLVGDPDPLPDPRRYDALRRRLLADHARDVLPALLQYGDAVSMAHGVESRLPFMDYRLVEWAFRAGPDLYRGGVTKAPVRAYLESHRLGAIANRADKLGFPTPMTHWFGSEAREAVAERLRSSSSPAREYLDAPTLESLLARASAGEYLAAFQIYKALTLDLWQRGLGAATRSPTAQAA